MILDDISQALQDGEPELTVELVQKALDEGKTAQDILENGLLAGMNIIGVLFKNDEIYMPEVLVCAMAMNEGAALLKPFLVEAGVEAKGVVVLGTVKGDLHDIGKNIVRMMMEGFGLTVIDLGIDVPDEKFVEAIKEHKPQVLALSALLTTTMAAQGDVIEAVKAAGLRDSVKIMVGGAPITQEFSDKIGADAYTPDAGSAAEVAVKLCTA